MVIGTSPYVEDGGLTIRDHLEAAETALVNLRRALADLYFSKALTVISHLKLSIRQLDELVAQMQKQVEGRS